MESAAVTFSQLVLSGIALVVGVLGYFLKDAMDEVKDHRIQLSTMHERFVKKDDFKEFKEELFSKLDDLKAQIKDK